MDMSWNTLSVVHHSSAFNNEGIDKTTGIICEINEVAIANLDLERLVSEPTTKDKKRTRTSVIIRRAIAAAKPKVGNVDPADRGLAPTIAEVVNVSDMF